MHDEVARLAPLVAAYCGRPAVRHELGLAAGAPPRVTPLPGDAFHFDFQVVGPDDRRWTARLARGSLEGLSSARAVAVEAQALRLVAPLRLAPALCFVDATLYHLPYGCLICDAPRGAHPDPRVAADAAAVAGALARLHALAVPAGIELRAVMHPMTAIWMEVAAQRDAGLADLPPAQLDLLNRLLRAAQRDLGSEAEVDGHVLSNGATAVDNWQRAVRAVSKLEVAGAALLESAPTGPSAWLRFWHRVCVADPVEDLAGWLSSAVGTARPVAQSADDYVAGFLAAYLRGRPGVAAPALHAKVMLRLRFAWLQRLSEDLSAGQRSLTPDVQPNVGALRDLFGPWLT